MALYEYACETCLETWEELQKFSDPPIDICPFCGKPNPIKLISIVNFKLKGGGWFKDGYNGTSNNQKEEKK